MYHIIHQIFQHFGAKILRELESLSHAWKQMFVLGKIWKMRLMENVSDYHFCVHTLPSLLLCKPNDFASGSLV